MEKPVPHKYGKSLNIAATQFWIENSQGGSYMLEWFGNGWVIRIKESYMLEDGTFEHREDIAGFNHSNMNPNGVEEHSHIFATKTDAIKVYYTKNSVGSSNYGSVTKSEDGYSIELDEIEYNIIQRQHDKLKNDPSILDKVVKVRIVQYVKVMKGDEEMIIEVPSFANKVTGEVVKEEAEIIYDFS